MFAESEDTAPPTTHVWSGVITDTSKGHSLKACSPILVVGFEIVTDFKEEHPLNAYSPI